ncbi:MAG: YqhA family protein [Cyanobacteria bacterium]|nr:YqhA family protein [Cyanobacteriota bacterium]
MSDPKSRRRAGGLVKGLELALEKLMWRFRLIALLPVVMSLVSTLATFILGTKSIFNSLKLLQSAGGLGDHDHELEVELLAGIVSGIDLYLIGIALLIFGYGIYELLVSSIDAARDLESPSATGLLDIRDLDQLKEKLVKVLVVALIVSAFKAMLTLKVTDAQSLVFFCFSVLLLALSGFLVTGYHPGKGK